MKCDAPEIQALDENLEPDHVMLIKAQAAIRDVLQKDWFDLYVQYVTEQKKKTKIKAATKETGHWNAEKRVCHLFSSETIMIDVSSSSFAFFLYAISCRKLPGLHLSVA